jgi:SAM-dependent methyltransferase
MVSLARVRLQGVHNISVHKNDGASLSMFPDGKFDFVFSFAVFQHIPSRAGVEAYLREIYRVLKAGGEMKVQVDGRGESLIWRYLQRLVSADSWFGVLFGSDEIAALVRKHGFEVVRTYRTTRGGRWALQELWIHARRPVSAMNP